MKVLLLALGLICAAAGTAFSQFEDVDRTLGELENELARYRGLAESTAPESSELESCRESASIGAILGDVERVSGVPHWRGEMRGVSRPLLHRQLCLSHEAGSPRCEDLEKVGGVEGPALARRCLRLYRQDLMVAAAMGAEPDALGRCHEAIRALWRDEPKSIDLKAAAPFCRLWLARRREPRAACEAMFAAGVFLQPGPAWRTKCADVLLVLAGDADYCAGLADPRRKRDLMSDSRTCSDYAAFRAAREAEDLGRCGSSSYCRKFMGSPAGCEAEEREVRAWYCGRFASLKAIDGLFAKARTSLADGRLRASPGVPERRRRLHALAALRSRLLFPASK